MQDIVVRYVGRHCYIQENIAILILVVEVITRKKNKKNCFGVSKKLTIFFDLCLNVSAEMHLDFINYIYVFRKNEKIVS